MIVKELIQRLQEMPSNLKVYWADHDHGMYETNSIVDECLLVDKNEMTDEEHDHSSDSDGCFTHTPKKYVCLRP